MAAGLYAKALGAILLLVIAQRCFHMVRQMGIFRIVYNHAPGPCHLVDDIVNGSEDLALLPNGKVVVSSGLRFLFSPFVANHWGAMYIFDLNYPDSRPEKLDIVGFSGPIFNPHGICAWSDKAAGRTYIFIVLHDPEAIGKFELDETALRLTLVNTYQSTYMTNVNSVVATSPNSFFFTNVLSTIDPWLGRIHMTLSIASGSIVHFNGTSYAYVLEGGHLANGLAASKDFRTFYLGVMEQLLVLNRSADNQLSIVSAVPLDFAPDNIFVDDNGAVWTAGVPRLFEAVQYLEGRSKFAGSRVLKIELSDHGHEITDVYVNDGRQLTGSSKAVYHQGRLLIGTFNHRLLYCDVAAF